MGAIPTSQQTPILVEDEFTKPSISGTGFTWGVRFKLPSSAHKGGFIIQMIEKITLLEVLAGGLPRNPQPKKVQYWEAWDVPAGRPEPTESFTAEATFKLSAAFAGDIKAKMRRNDWFGDDLSGQAGGTVGSITQTGIARFFELTALPTGFIRSNPATPLAGTLRASINQPNFFLSWDAGLYRQLVYTIDKRPARPIQTLRTFVAASRSQVTGPPPLAKFRSH
jgi:hypothetical protein